MVSNTATIVTPEHDNVNLKTFNTQQVRRPSTSKDVSTPFRKYFIAAKTRRKTASNTYVSGRAMKKHTILSEFNRTL